MGRKRRARQTQGTRVRAAEKSETAKAPKQEATPAASEPWWVLPDTVHAPSPWQGLYWILIAAFLLRAAVALAGDFVVHPDEIMQYLESAHAVVFGSGITHWEFFFGGRSWFLPGMVASVLWLCKLVGLGEPTYYIPAVKLVFCAISLLIPTALYFLGRRLFGEVTGRVALVLGAFWYELVGFAHKPMTEFLATGILLVMVAIALRPPSPRRTATVGALAGLVVAVRFQYVFAAAILPLRDLVRGSGRTRFATVASGMAVVLLAGVFDYLTWGELFHSYLVNFRFNMSLDSARINEPSQFQYLVQLAVASGGTFLAAVAASADLRKRILPLSLAVAVLLPHMLQSHHEYRYVFAVVPLWLLLFADVLARGWRPSSSAGGAADHAQVQPKTCHRSRVRRAWSRSWESSTHSPSKIFWECTLLAHRSRSRLISSAIKTLFLPPTEGFLRCRPYAESSTLPAHIMTARATTISTRGFHSIPLKLPQNFSILWKLKTMSAT